MEITATVHPADRAAWRAWLAEHHDDASEIWLVTWRSAIGRPSVAYADAVEEALCFGWIDSTRKKLDEERLAQRFTPRRPGIPMSQANRERLAALAELGLVLPRVRRQLEEQRPEAFVIPGDIEAALREDAEAWRQWKTFTPAYRRIRAAYVEQARDRDAEQFRKRLSHLVRRTREGRRFGYGIERFY